jgi:anti-sigma regulatory factor (Ser/Thr protein kinase)
MDVTDAKFIEVLDSSQVSEARRTVVAAAAEHGFEQADLDRLTLVATELGTNLIKHPPRGGYFLMQGLLCNGDYGIDLFALDNGDGMDVPTCVVDGYSTTGTLGTGLGAVRRLSNSFEALSRPGRGTVIHTRMWAKSSAKFTSTSSVSSTAASAAKSSSSLSSAGLTVPLKGELVSGDKWSVCELDDGLYCLLVDGLGHGFEAAEAASLAVRRFKENLSLRPGEMIKLLHNSLRGTRGAVAAVARIDLKGELLRYAGLGNIVGLLGDGTDRRHLVSLNGTLGYESRKITEFELPWSSNSSLIMHSDGLPSRAIDELDDLTTTSPSLIAASLFFHQTKGTDDASVVVVNNNR